MACREDVPATSVCGGVSVTARNTSSISRCARGRNRSLSGRAAFPTSASTRSDVDNATDGSGAPGTVSLWRMAFAASPPASPSHLPSKRTKADNVRSVGQMSRKHPKSRISVWSCDISPGAYGPSTLPMSATPSAPFSHVATRTPSHCQPVDAPRTTGSDAVACAVFDTVDAVCAAGSPSRASPSSPTARSCCGTRMPTRPSALISTKDFGPKASVPSTDNALCRCAGNASCHALRNACVSASATPPTPACAQ